MNTYLLREERMSLVNTYLLPEERTTLRWLADSPSGVRTRAPRPDDAPVDAEERWARLLHHLMRLGLAERVGRAGQTSFRYILTHQGRIEAHRHRLMPRQGDRS